MFAFITTLRALEATFNCAAIGWLYQYLRSLFISHVRLHRCLLALLVHAYITTARGEDIYVNGIPPYCPQYNSYNFTFQLLASEVTYEAQREDGYSAYLILALTYFVGDVAWLCMVWTAASIGSPTEPLKRDYYLR